MSAYAEKLKHPKWQKKRLEILERDGFKCYHCRDDSETLHVHHIYYERGKQPWEYPSEAYVTLCATCHEQEEGRRLMISKLIGPSRVNGRAAFVFLTALTGSMPLNHPAASNFASSLAPILNELADALIELEWDCDALDSHVMEAIRSLMLIRDVAVRANLDVQALAKKGDSR